MAQSVDHQICFRLADAVPAAPLPGPLRLGDAQAEALSELLQVFACGEESASLAFARLGDSPLEDAPRWALLGRCVCYIIPEESAALERELRRITVSAGIRNADHEH